MHSDDIEALVRPLVTGNIDNDNPGVRILALGGYETLSYPEFVRRIASGIGVDAKLVRIPSWLIETGIWITHRLDRLRPVTPAMVARQRMDLVVDDTGARGRLDWNPRPFRP